MKLTIGQLKRIIKEVVEGASGKANSPQTSVSVSEALRLGILSRRAHDSFSYNFDDYTFYKTVPPAGAWTYTEEPLPRTALMIALDHSQQEALAFDGSQWEPIGPFLGAPDDGDKFVAYRRWLGIE